MGFLGSVIGGAVGFAIGGPAGAVIGAGILGGAEDAAAAAETGEKQRHLIDLSIAEVKRQKEESIEALGLRRDISEANLSLEQRQARIEALFTKSAQSRETQLLQAQIRFQASQNAGTFGQSAEQALGTLSRKQVTVIEEQEVRRGEAFALRAEQISTEFELSTKAIEADERQRLINAESGILASRTQEAQGINQAIGGFVNTALGAQGLFSSGGNTSNIFTSPFTASGSGTSTGLGISQDFTIGLS